VTDNYTPASPFNYVAILGSITSAKTVTRDGATIPNVGSPESLAASPSDAWYWNEQLDIVFVKVFDNRADTLVSASY
jgi:hypothetical protein